MERTTKIIQQNSLGGTLWFSGWLFSLGFLKPGILKALFALIVWPYFIGEYVADKMNDAPEIEQGHSRE